MASKVPVVSTRSVGIDEIVIDGETGFLVNDDDMQSLTEKIMYLIKHKEIAKQFGEKARNYVLENYSIDKMIRNYEQLYIQLYNKKTKPCD